MYRWNSDANRDCDGVSRRDFFRVGGLGLAGITLADLLRLESLAGKSSSRAQSVILLWMQGGPSHIDTLDPKPDCASRDPR